MLEHSSHHGVGAAVEVPLQFVDGLLDRLDAVVDGFVEGVVVVEVDSGQRCFDGRQEFGGGRSSSGVARSCSDRMASGLYPAISSASDCSASRSIERRNRSMSGVTGYRTPPGPITFFTR